MEPELIGFKFVSRLEKMRLQFRRGAECASGVEERLGWHVGIGKVWGPPIYLQYP